MSPAVQTSSNLALVARRLESDLRSRGLAEGDRYLGVQDASLLLGVSPAMAHRAMRLLVSRGLLTRHRGKGTFVGEEVGKDKKSGRLRTIFVLMPEDQVEITGVQLDVMIGAIRNHFRGYSIQFGFVPPENGLEYVRELIGEAQRAGSFAAAVPISCSRAVYRYLANLGVPVVVLGSTYDDLRELASVDLDYRQAGYLLAHYLVNRGHRRIALLSTGNGRPGDDAFYDGVSEALTEAKLPHNSLLVRTFPKDLDAFKAQVKQLLLRQDRPTAAICGSYRFSDAVQSVIAELRTTSPIDLELVFESRAGADANGKLYTHIQPSVPFPQSVDLLARMLKQLADGVVPEQRVVVIPVELSVPGNG